jgi:GMP synthase (glutamine-hydrolysing)
MEQDSKIAVVDMGGQYAHLIASRVRRLGAYTEILSNDENVSVFKKFSGIILSGGPESVYEPSSPSIDKRLLDLNIPILGICYGHQLLMKLLGGKVEPSSNREYGMAFIELDMSEKFNRITKGLSSQELVWMSHGDEVVSLPEGFLRFAGSKDCQNAGVIHLEKNIIGLQFHPEVTHTEKGLLVLQNFISICGVSKTWNIYQFLEAKILEIKQSLEHKKVFMLISGGVDSTVSYILLSKAIGAERIKGLLIDTGFMRKNEISVLRAKLHSLGLDVTIVDESERFYSQVKNITDPETKRKLMGQLFLDAKKDAWEKLHLEPTEWILGQGTIYPDTIESGGTKYAHSIKTHHNRVDAVLELLEKGEIIEPIKELYKDEVRELGVILGIDRSWTMRHPFPGPGLVVRMINSISEPTQATINKLEQTVLGFQSISTTILPVSSVGVQGDQRTYQNCALLNDFSIDWDNYSKVSTLITNTIQEINRVVYMPFQKQLPENFVITQILLDKEHSDILREADHVVNETLIKYKLLSEIWQFPVVLLPLGKTKETFSIVLRPVESLEAMTANFYKMQRQILREMVDQILSIEKISFVFYDITNKPPGTIEWE